MLLRLTAILAAVARAQGGVATVACSKHTHVCVVLLHVLPWLARYRVPALLCDGGGVCKRTRRQQRDVT